MLTRERALQLFEYDEETGELRWRIDRHIQRSGARAGHQKSDGYRVVSLRRDGRCRQFGEHQIIWLMKTGDWSSRERPLDHINGIRSDNRWANLRRVTFRQNATNKHKVRAASGALGVRVRPAGFEASFGHQSTGSYKYLGTFRTLEAARAAVAGARAEHFVSIDA